MREATWAIKAYICSAFFLLLHLREASLLAARFFSAKAVNPLGRASIKCLILDPKTWSVGMPSSVCSPLSHTWSTGKQNSAKELEGQTIHSIIEDSNAKIHLCWNYKREPCEVDDKGRSCMHSLEIQRWGKKRKKNLGIRHSNVV